MIFLISLLVSDFQRSVWSVPSISVAVLGQAYTVHGGRNLPFPQGPTPPLHIAIDQVNVSICPAQTLVGNWGLASTSK